MNLKSLLILFTIVVSISLLINNGAIARVEAEGIYKYDGRNFVQVPGHLSKIEVGNNANVWGLY
jgi:hypothetical protein